MPFVLQLYMGVVIFVKENNNNGMDTSSYVINTSKENNNNDINANLDHEKDNTIISMPIKNNDKVGFFGDIDTFLELKKKQIGSILTKPLSELFEKEHEINGKTSTLNVTYKKSQNNNDKVYKKTNAKNNSEVNIVDIFLPVVLDENIEQSIEECENYNKMMWKKYLNTITDQDRCSPVYKKYERNFGSHNYQAENFKYQCEFYNKLIDKFIDERHLMPPEKKRAASIFFYTLAVLAIIWFFLCIFVPGLSISLIVQFGALFEITTEIAFKIMCATYCFAPITAVIFFKLGRYISWKQNDYEEGTNLELYSKYNEKLKQYKIGRADLTGEQCKIGECEYNYTKTKAQNCPLFKYYHQQVQKEDKNKKKCLVWELKSNTKTPLELLLKLKKAYEIPEQFKNTESKAFGVKSK